MDAKYDMIKSLNEYFVIPNDSTRFATELEYDIDLSSSLEDWTRPTEITGFEITRFSRLQKEYSHDGEIYGIAYNMTDLAGHYNFPLKRDSTYLPDSIVAKYNKFSRIYNGLDSLELDENIYYEELIRDMKHFVDNSEAPHSGYSNDVTIEVEYENRKKEFNWTAHFDLDKKFLYYE